MLYDVIWCHVCILVAIHRVLCDIYINVIEKKRFLKYLWNCFNCPNDYFLISLANPTSPTISTKKRSIPTDHRSTRPTTVTAATKPATSRGPSKTKRELHTFQIRYSSPQINGKHWFRKLSALIFTSTDITFTMPYTTTVTVPPYTQEPKFITTWATCNCLLT